MEKQPLISVVIPVYNVEAYIRRCVESVIIQSYDNLEIILINDGSTDCSGKICDEYTKGDRRIKVIHKENGGLSDARNVGLNVSLGDYIAFIDSDDFVSQVYIQRLHDLLVTYDADISVVNKYNFSNCKKIKIREKTPRIKCYNGVSAIEDMWYQRNIINASWGKLYKKVLFQQIRFPLGKMYEDLGTTYKLFYLSEKIVYSSEKLYYYFQREDSIMNRKFTLKNMDRIEICEEILEWSERNCKELKEAAIARFFLSNMQVLREIPSINEYQEQIQYISDNIRKYRMQVMHNKKVKLINRVIAYSGRFDINFLKRMGYVYKKIFH